MAKTQISLDTQAQDATLTPAKVSTIATDDFSFPRDVSAGRDLKISDDNKLSLGTATGGAFLQNDSTNYWVLFQSSFDGSKDATLAFENSGGFVHTTNGAGVYFDAGGNGTLASNTAAGNRNIFLNGNNSFSNGGTDRHVGAQIGTSGPGNGLLLGATRDESTATNSFVFSSNDIPLALGVVDNSSTWFESLVIGKTLFTSNVDMDMTTHKITNLAEPTSDQDAATKYYVDNAGGGGGANTSLSNLSSVSINSSLFFDTDNTYQIGSEAERLQVLWSLVYGLNDASPINFIDASDGFTKLQVNSKGVFVPIGDEINPSYGFEAQAGWGIYYDNGFNAIGMSTGSGKALTLDNNGALTLYQGAAGYNIDSLMHLWSDNQALYLDNTSSGRGGAPLLYIRDSSETVFYTFNDSSFDMVSKPIINVSDPTNPQDAATKNYVDSAGGPSIATVTTASYTAAGDHIILTDATSNAITVALPAASGNSGMQYVIKKIDSSANTVTIDADASETIDGALTYVETTQYESVTIVCDGSNWFII